MTTTRRSTHPLRAGARIPKCDAKGCKFGDAMVHLAVAYPNGEVIERDLCHRHQFVMRGSSGTLKAKTYHYDPLTGRRA